MDWRNGRAWVSCDEESNFVRWSWWIGEVIGEETVVIRIKGSECR